MNKKETENAIKVMQAFVDGKKIECRLMYGGDIWEVHSSTQDPQWAWHTFEYRIKKPQAVELGVGMVLFKADGYTNKYREVLAVYNGDVCYSLQGIMVMMPISELAKDFVVEIDGEEHPIKVGV